MERVFDEEAFVVFARHGYIDVVVPRNEASVAYCPKQRAGIELIAQIALAAEGVNITKNIEFDLLYLV